MNSKQAIGITKDSKIFLECGSDVSEHAITFAINILIDLCNKHCFRHEQGKMLQLLNKLQRLRTYSDCQHRSAPALLGEITEIIMCHSSMHLALPLLLEQLKIKKRNLGCDHRDLAAILCNIGQVYEKHDKLSKAKCYFQDSSRALKMHKIRGCRETAMICCMGLFSYHQALHAEAFENLTFAINGQQHIVGDFHPKTAEMQIELRNYELKDGKVKDALTNFLEALVMMQMCFGNDHPKISEVLHQIALVRKMKGEHAEALNAVNQAQRISGVQDDKRSMI